MVKADLHNHLRTSSRLVTGDFNNAVNTAVKTLGAGGILGVVNFSDFRYEHLIQSSGYEREVLDNGSAVYVPSRNIYLVKGQEIPTLEGHVLAYGAPQRVHLKENRSLKDTIKEAKDNNTILIADHPFHYGGLGRDVYIFLPEFDALEVHNGESAFGLPMGPFPIGANQEAIEFYKRVKSLYPNLGAISSSDGHSFYEIGSSWTDIELPNKKDFINSLRNSLRKTDLFTPMKMTNSVLGAIHHISSWALMTQVGFRLGLRESYLGTDRPINN